jgi:hypothetical protein
VQATVAQFGQFTHVGWRTVRDRDGREQQVQQFELTAEDSKPVGETLQQLDRVAVKLFEDGVHVADVTAQRAFVEIGRDANGRPSLTENKDLDLRDVVLSTLAGSKLAGLRLAIGDARVAIGETEITLVTQETQPVLVVFEGERKTTLRGIGLRARLPRSPKNPAARGEIEILSDPVLEADGATVRARGRLHYLEDIGAGTATMTVHDEVQLDMERADLRMPGLDGGDATGTPGRTTVRGDRFEGRLLRGKETTATGQERQRVWWRRLDLFGAPATVDMSDGQLKTPQLTVLPGLFGETFQITAHGGASHLSTTVPGRRGKPAETLVAAAERRIHLIQPMEQSGAMHRAMGFPAWTLRPIADSQIVVTEGRSHVEVGTRKADASGGIRVLRQEDRDAGVVHGLGDVVLESRPGSGKGEPLQLTGNDGFVLTSTEALETLRLGPIGPDAIAPGTVPPAAFAAHQFRIRQGDADLQGSGGCLVERRGERTDLWLLAPEASIVANVPADGLELRSVHELRGALLGRNAADLRVVGWPVELVTERRGDRITARAPHVRQLGPSSLRLEKVPEDRPTGLWRGLPKDAWLPRLHGTGTTRDGDEFDVEVSGPHIDVHHAGGHTAVLDAESDWTLLQPTVTARLNRPGQDQPMQLSCRAQRIRMLPHVLPPAVRQLYTGRKHSVLADVGFASPGNPWLLLEQVADFQLDDPKEGHLDGTCDRLLISQGGRAALFVGNAEAMAPAVVRRVHSGRDVRMEGARVRVLQGTDDQLLAMGSFADRDTFLPPKVTLHELGKNGLLSHMQATCHGSIEVRNDGVNFLGPVRALGLRPDGSADPEGLRIDARELRMVRHLRTGDVVKVLAKGVMLDWPRMAARTAELEIDLERQRCLAKDPNGAEITVPGWPTFRSPEVDFHYPTMTLRAPRLRAVQDAPAPSLGGGDR